MKIDIRTVERWQSDIFSLSDIVTNTEEKQKIFNIADTISAEIEELKNEPENIVEFHDLHRELCWKQKRTLLDETKCECETEVKQK